MKKALILIFLTLIITKIILSLFIQVPLGYSDSLTYMESASNFFNSQDFSELAESKYPPLYSIIISIAFIFESMQGVHLAIKVINAMLTSLIIFPAYFFAKEFFNKKKSILIASIISFLPPMFIFTFSFMSENLFYTLLLTTLYFLYKSFKEDNLKFDIITGILIGLCYLTRSLAIFLFPLIIILILFNIKTIKKKIFLILVTIATILPWIMVKGNLYGFTMGGITGYGGHIEQATQGMHLVSKIIWIFLYTEYLIIAVGIVFFILSLQAIIKYTKQSLDKKLLIQITLLSTFFLILIGANHSGFYENYNTAGILGRYIAGIFPLFIILGSTQKAPNKIITILTAIFIAITTPFILFNLFFPLNNSSLAHIGVLDYILPSTIIITTILTLITISLILIKKINLKLILIFFILLTSLNCAIIYYDSEYRWEPTEPVQIGIWFDQNIDQPTTILLDKEQIENYEYQQSEEITQSNQRSLQVMAYWLKDYTIDDLTNYREYDYIVTKEYLPYPIVFVSEEATKVYYNP